MLKIENLTVNYLNQQQASVKKFNLTVNSGEIVCIVGESGSGKSTVLKTILGALPKTIQIQADKLTLAKQSLLSYTAKDWQKIRGSKVSLIFQDSGAALNPIRKIGDQFVEYIQQHSKLSKQVAYQKAKELLVKMHLSDEESIMQSYPHQLSGGMCQRVGIALAMTFNPELLLADEPTSALDVTTQRQIVNELLALQKNFNTSIVMVTHNLGLAAYMADQLIVMEKGQVVDSGPTINVLENPQSDYTKKLLAAVPEI
ncbi:peptide/nickel transport system ATP-binding protein [Enterococcus sp. PF1-24]|uniref:ABC transporter ATP-binding protein n=1 Tax=unclassified Enterococcus TaxID=2608891 RepID=UPI0024762E12|nr:MULTISPECIES: ABC transporter ATP-binding protein [unclassified Enterococcus]MDH6363247.1 peptide/nickel transport system ATP-binding protein [Enterococcus sp. PFB1-1]MDH6400452.1 peptide/nickel transport system ATP-binding protein [Enterococcus sp. PF1-24]